MAGGRTKAGVMAALRRPQDGVAKFSKYSGVVEWQNAIVLWVNVGGRDYNNAFEDGGQRMTWCEKKAAKTLNIAGGESYEAIFGCTIPPPARIVFTRYFMNSLVTRVTPGSPARSTTTARP